MNILSYDYGDVKKFIIYSDADNSSKAILYVWRIFTNREITELSKYDDGQVTDISEIKLILPFSKKKPEESINKFYKILVLQS